MKSRQENNYAFIDSQNVNLGIQELGWKLDWKKFRIYLHDHFQVQEAYLFLGYIKKYESMYKNLKKDGYKLIFKPIKFEGKDKHIKGNCDGELILQAAVELQNYDKALIVSGDGDFYCLVNYLQKIGKLKYVLAPNKNHCSFLLRQSARKKLLFLDEFRWKLFYKAKGTA